jgi:2-dehydropantoate 2-reductase
VLLGRTPTLTFGELNGARSKRIDAIATTVQDAGFTMRASNAVLLEMWEKWVLLATLAGMTCLMRGAVGDIVAAGAAGLMEALLEECRHIAASQDQMIRPDVLQRTRAILTEASSTLTASMLRDLERGTVTEADHVLGDLLHRQSELAVASPSLLRIAYLHLKTYEAKRAREGIPSAGACSETVPPEHTY